MMVSLNGWNSSLVVRGDLRGRGNAIWADDARMQAGMGRLLSLFAKSLSWTQDMLNISVGSAYNVCACDT